MMPTCRLVTVAFAMSSEGEVSSLSHEVSGYETSRRKSA
jgi:hypothetical protein